VDEVKAFQILTGAEAIPIGAGGVHGAGGAIVLVVKGREDQVKKSLEIANAVKGTEEPPTAPPECKSCRYPRCSLGEEAA
jgi:hypothetical protein